MTAHGRTDTRREAALRRYTLFGARVESDLPLDILSHATAASCGAGTADLELTLVPHAGSLADAAPARPDPVYVSPFRDELGHPALEVFALPEVDVLHFPGLADFHVAARRIVLRRMGPDPGHVAELRLLGPVLAVWLERQGIPVLHGSAVAIGGRAVAFLGPKGQGKSFLAAELLRRGCSLVTDDMLAVESQGVAVAARPAYPLMRMDPAMARRFVGDRNDLARVHPRADKRWVPVGPGGFGAFCDEPTPLRRIYLLERLDAGEREPAVEIGAIPPARAVIELVTHSFSPRMIAALGLEAARLSHLTGIAAAASVRRLTYVAGDRHVSALCQAVLDDLASG